MLKDFHSSKYCQIYEWIYELTFFVTSLPYEYLSVQTSVWSKQLLEQDLGLNHNQLYRPKLNKILWFFFTADATMNQLENRFWSQFSLEEHHYARIKTAVTFSLVKQSPILD